jgi:hypothetical protein
MRYVISFALLAGFAAFASPASAVTCANGVYRAGCVGPNGAAVARKPTPYYNAHPYHGGTVTCAKGVYRAGCAGPNGTAVRRY